VAAGAQDPPSHSRAFENFVETGSDERDVVGLIAYALYKQGIREEAISGTAAPGAQRNPPTTTVTTYRAAATQLLTEIVQRAIDETTPEIQRSAVLNAVETAKAEIKGHVTGRTNFGPALLTNIIAWIVTLAIAVLILRLAGSPGVDQTLVNAVR